MWLSRVRTSASVRLGWSRRHACRSTGSGGRHQAQLGARAAASTQVSLGSTAFVVGGGRQCPTQTCIELATLACGLQTPRPASLPRTTHADDAVWPQPAGGAHVMPRHVLCWWVCVKRARTPTAGLAGATSSKERRAVPGTSPPSSPRHSAYKLPGPTSASLLAAGICTSTGRPLMVWVAHPFGPAHTGERSTMLALTHKRRRGWPTGCADEAS